MLSVSFQSLVQASLNVLDQWSHYFCLPNNKKCYEPAVQKDMLPMTIGQSQMLKIVHKTIFFILYYFKDNPTMVSTCAVWANMSTGWIYLTSYVDDKYFRSLARVSGSQEI